MPPPVLLAASIPPITENGHSYQVPWGNGREVYRLGDGGPVPVQVFHVWQGRSWRIYWDDALETPRYVHPLEPRALAFPGADGALLADEVEFFVDQNRQFFGAGALELGEPSVRRLGPAWLLVFPQTTEGGIPVRGAGLRAVVLEDGTLGWIKAFLRRECPDPAEPLIDERAAVSALIAAVGGTAHEARLEMGFPAEAPALPIPLWSVQATDAEGNHVENLIDARTGELLARRRVVKHFAAEGVVLGRYPPGLGASPQTGLPALNPLGGLTIRDAAGREIGATGPDGAYRLDVPQNPVSLTFSLEQGERPGGAGGAYRPGLEITPLGSGFGPILRPEEDVNGDGIPDATITQAVGEKGLVILNGGEEGEAAVLRAWALMCYVHAARVLDFAQAVRRDFQLASPLPPLRIIPKPGAPVQQFVAPNPGANGFGEIVTALAFAGIDAARNPFTEFMLPTILQHEVGHHVFFALTNVEDPGPISIEEAAADLMAAFTNGLPELGFKDPGVPTAAGFRLGETGDLRAPLRARFGNAFWRLFELLDDPSRQGGPDPRAAHGLLFHWLEAHRADTRDQVIFDETRTLRDELIRLDATVMVRSAADRLCAPCHEEEIAAVFRDDFFAGPFVRGDSNLDRKVDLSDAVATLNFLFAGGRFHDCREALDADDSGVIDVTDAIRTLVYLFQGGTALPEPFPACGFDARDFAGEVDLGCFEYTCPR
jgi:hypothetical protein